MGSKTQEKLKEAREKIKNKVLEENAGEIPEILEEARAKAVTTKDYIAVADAIASYAGIERTKETPVGPVVAGGAGIVIPGEALAAMVGGLAKMFGVSQVDMGAIQDMRQEGAVSLVEEEGALSIAEEVEDAEVSIVEEVVETSESDYYQRFVDGG
jgi:hypothetical protein